MTHSVDRVPLQPLADAPQAISGHELILELEDRYAVLADKTLQHNPFWRALVDRPMETPDRIYFGLCLENYQLLVRESYFDAPALPYPGNETVRRLLNEFYCEELGHDRLLLQSLEAIGLSEAALSKSIALPGTMALCNALSYWARHDPLFFLTTLGPLEGREVEIDSYVVAARQKGLPAEFVGPIAKHAGINKDAGHGALTRQIFAAIPSISVQDSRRLHRQTELFVAIYDRFYRDIWAYYSSDAPMLRRVDAL